LEDSLIRPNGIVLGFGYLLYLYFRPERADKIEVPAKPAKMRKYRGCKRKWGSGEGAVVQSYIYPAFDELVRLLTETLLM
jgi:hypothetical protein